MKRSYLLLIILLPILIFFHTRGAVINDEGYLLYSAEKILNGLIPYKDFHFVYTPMSIFLTAFSFWIFAPSILASRILMIFLSFITTILIYKIILKTTKNGLYALLASAIYVAWGPSHINFAWPVMFAIFFSILSLFLIVKYDETKLERYLFFAGFITFLVFLSKQNFGTAILCLPIFYFLFNFKNTINLLNFIYGYIWAIIIFGIYLIWTSSLSAFLYNLYLFTYQMIIVDNRLTTNFIYHDKFLPMVLRTLLYLSPAIISLLALFVLAFHKKVYLLYIPFFTLSFYIAGIRPTTDYVHLVPLLSIAGIPLVLFIRFNTSSISRMCALVISIAFIIAGFQTALYKGYYRWDQPLIYHNNFFSNPKINIFLNDKSYVIYKDFVQTINNEKANNNYVFINSYDDMLYFISSKKEPTKSNFLTTFVSPQIYYDETEAAIVTKKIPFVIIPKNSLPTLVFHNYIEKKYTFLKTIDVFDIYKLNP